MKPIIVAPLVALALAGGSAGAYFWLTSEGRVEEAVVVQPTPTPTQPPGGAGGGGEYTPVPTTPFPSPPPIPTDWATYIDPEGRFTVRYPPTWSVGEGGLYSFDTSTWSGPGLPPNSVKVEVGYNPAAGLSGCGVLDRVPGTTGSDRAQDFVPVPDAAPATFGGVPGAQVIRLFDPATSGGLTRLHAIDVVYKGYCFGIAAYFHQDDPDEATFLQIASSFRFSD